ncbi:biotin--protein ligase [Hydrococcus rivularis NIES-593]|uniref:Biotin--protein ligase n=1 Tax=Hydrococcus rivularis NIES-593 TaxID=1921803 RepID=A0A1U7H8L3_9CYAN|nr:biotin/lipoate A/B protein ligase family protein [Hydrococcus rivularis]OKH19475.1 biotin--protein ligase [Hydrococcus rivularis NIES-593]
MTNPQSYWRLIPLLEATGEMQMAIDRWLLQQHRQGKHPPTLRFYTWSPAAISVGYHQHHYPEHWRQLTWQGKPIDLVRRPTGGRAVLHQGDLTYMVVASGIPGRRTEVYQKICEFLVRGWRSLGIELRYGSAGRGYIHNPNCFGTATNADLVAPDGRKLIGSAQLRQGNAILQHGSILLSPDRLLFRQVFGDSAPEPVNLPIQLAETRMSQQVVVQALTEAASQCFGIELVTRPLSEIELQEIYCANVSDRARHPILNSG